MEQMMSGYCRAQDQARLVLCELEAGAAEIDGKRLDVVTQGEYLEAGTPVEVLRVEGNRIVVRKIGGLQSAGE